MTDLPRLGWADLTPDPMPLVERWVDEARRHAGVTNYDAMCLSTLGPDGFPEGRIVLLKGCDAEGVVFFTNLESDKARALRDTPRAACTFYWESLGRQLRVRGTVEPVSDGEADAYFATRRRGSQIGAWASLQSRPLESREALEAAVARIEVRFGEGPVPRPPHWSGYRVRPVQVEFWQEGRFRLHDRFCYRRVDGDPERWERSRLYP